jgi:hypothetical protein
VLRALSVSSSLTLSLYLAKSTSYKFPNFHLFHFILTLLLIWPLLDNGSVIHVSAATKSRNSSLLVNGSPKINFVVTDERVNKRGFIWDGDLYSLHLEVSSVQEISVGRDSPFGIRHSGREDTRSPVRNGASLKQPLIVSCYNWL